MTADSLEWPAMALGSIGAEFEVVSPPELLDFVREWADRFSRRRPAEGLGHRPLREKVGAGASNGWASGRPDHQPTRSRPS